MKNILFISKIKELLFYNDEIKHHEKKASNKKIVSYFYRHEIDSRVKNQQHEITTLN